MDLSKLIIHYLYSSGDETVDIVDLCIDPFN